jgi:hypothetical protein
MLTDILFNFYPILLQREHHVQINVLVKRLDRKRDATSLLP